MPITFPVIKTEDEVSRICMYIDIHTSQYPVLPIFIPVSTLWNGI
jgi:hypothetical protein